MLNLEIRAAVTGAGIKMWQLAEALHVHESTLSRKLRHELEPDEKEQILTVIKRIENK